jgi:hypothetical protein
VVVVEDPVEVLLEPVVVAELEVSVEEAVEEDSVEEVVELEEAVDEAVTVEEVLEALEVTEAELLAADEDGETPPSTPNCSL